MQDAGVYRQIECVSIKGINLSKLIYTGRQIRYSNLKKDVEFEILIKKLKTELLQHYSISALFQNVLENKSYIDGKSMTTEMFELINYESHSNNERTANTR